MKRLQGTWEVVRAEFEGKAYPEAIGCRRVFDGATITYVDSSGKTELGRYVIDTRKQPAWIDCARMEEGRMLVSRGIYRLEGDTLTLCSASPGKPRPGDFATTASAIEGLLVLRRVSR